MPAKQSYISVTLVVVVLMVTVAPSWGITIRHDRTDSQYTTLADTLFPYGGQMSGPGWYGSGTLISPTWVLTAKHALGTSFVTSAGSFSVAETIGHPDYDIGLARLTSPITTIDPVSLYSLDFGIEDGLECITLGVGNTGTGITGEVSGTGGARRAADTYVHANASAWGWGSEKVLTLFRDPRGGTPGGTPGNLEGGGAHGDSGGGLLLNVDGEYGIAGVMSQAWSGGGGGAVIGMYYTGGVYVRSAPLNDWITTYATDAVIVGTDPVETPGRIPPHKITATATEQWWEFGGVNVLYNGSGLTDGLHDADMAHSWGAGNHPWSTPPNGMNDGNGSMATVQFTFDESYYLDGLKIWSLGDWMGGGGSYRMGPEDVLIEYSMVENPSTPADWTDWYSGTLDEQDGSTVPWPETQTLDLTNITAKHIALSLLDSWNPDTNAYVGLSEIQFLLVPDDLPGDVNGDGWVGGDDLSIILTNWGLSGQSREQGDLTGEGFIGGDDYSEVLTYWGTGTPPDSLVTSIPEPATLALLLLAGLSLLRRRRRA